MVDKILRYELYYLALAHHASNKVLCSIMAGEIIKRDFFESNVLDLLLWFRNKPCNLRDEAVDLYRNSKQKKLMKKQEYKNIREIFLNGNPDFALFTELTRD